MADIKTFAADLKAVREDKNLTLKDISQQTRLNVTILENIENGEFTFQPQAYIRAFLKQYINSLDLDMDETLFDYDLARSGKYKPKQSSYPSDEQVDNEEPQEPKSSRTKFTEKIKGFVDSPKKVTDERKVENPEEEIQKLDNEPEDNSENRTEINLRDENIDIEIRDRNREEIEDIQEDAKQESAEEIRERMRNEIREEVRNEIRQEVKKEVKEEIRNEIPEIKKEVKAAPPPVQKRPEERFYTTPDRNREKKKISLSFLNSPLVRNIFMFLFVLLVLLALYSLANILFFDGSKDKPEVIRQNFDDVVKEQEKKILGKRTPEEIQDSIKKAQEELAAAGDSITLKITGLEAGSFFLVTDSTNYSKPERINFKKGDLGIFKAKKNFFISMDNTDNVKATVNDIPLKFDDKSVSKVKINRSGIDK